MIPRLKADLHISDLKTIWPSGSKRQNIRNFEIAFARMAGQKHAVAFPYGRTAQMALLKVLDLVGDQVICPSYTCVVVPHAIVKSGHTPVFVDVCEDDYNMDWDFVEAATNEHTGAIIATSIFGHPVNREALAAYRLRHPDVFIIQDCAHSFLAGDMNRQGIAAFYGLNISKIITSVFGGMVTTDDDDLARNLMKERARMLHPAGVTKEVKRALYLAAVLVAFNPIIYGLVSKLERLGVLDKFVKYYDPEVIDLPTDAFEEMCSIEARLGRSQCDHYHNIVSHRRKLASIYREGLDGVSDFVLPPNHEGATYSHFVVRTSKAEELKLHCLRNGVQLGGLIEYEIPDMPTYASAQYFGEHRSRIFPTQMLNLPVHTGVNAASARGIVELLKNC